MKRARILTHRLDDGVWVIIVDGAELTQAGTIFPTFTTRQEAIQWCRLTRVGAPSDDPAPVARR